MALSFFFLSLYIYMWRERERGVEQTMCIVGCVGCLDAAGQASLAAALPFKGSGSQEFGVDSRFPSHCEPARARYLPIKGGKSGKR